MQREKKTVFKAQNGIVSCEPWSWYKIYKKSAVYLICCAFLFFLLKLVPSFCSQIPIASTAAHFNLYMMKMFCYVYIFVKIRFSNASQVIRVRKSITSTVYMLQQRRKCTTNQMALYSSQWMQFSRQPVIFLFNGAKQLRVIFGYYVANNIFPLISLLESFAVCA